MGLRRTFYKLGRYGLAGGAALATHLIVLSVIVELELFTKTAATALGFACAIPVNYFLLHRFVFGQIGRHEQYFPRYIAVTLFTMGLNSAVFWFLAEFLGIHYLTSQVATTAAVMLANFVINSSFTFVTWSGLSKS